MPATEQGYDDDWGRDGILNGVPAQNEDLPQYLAIANVLLQWRIVQAMGNMKRSNDALQARASKAWAENKTDAVAVLDALPDNLGLMTGGTTMSHLSAKLQKRLPAADCLGTLVELWMSNAFAPYEVKVDDEVLRAAAQVFTQDLGCPPSWADAAERAVRDAQKLLGRERNFRWLIMAAAGVALAALAWPLATALAPAGLAGGAAFLSGLAALGGSGGLIGGLSVVIGVAAAGTATATVGATLAAGSVQEVEDRVIILYARAVCKLDLRPGTHDILEKKLLHEMTQDLQRRRDRHLKVEGKGRNVKDIEKKLNAVDKALTSLKSEERNG